jgi:hypothetical protein
VLWITLQHYGKMASLFNFPQIAVRPASPWYHGKNSPGL